MLKGYRTIIINVLTIGAAILAQLTASPGSLPEEYMYYALMVLAVVNTLLRFITDTPVGSASPK